MVLWASGWPARMVLVGVIRAYRSVLSPVTGGRCRFHPTCSAYAEGAVRARGAVVGSLLTVWRVLRCSPLSRGGVDLPPASPAWRSQASVSPEYDIVIPALTWESRA